MILRFFAVEGRFPCEKAETPEEAVRYVAEQARVQAEEWPRYARPARRRLPIYGREDRSLRLRWFAGNVAWGVRGVWEKPR